MWSIYSSDCSFVAFVSESFVYWSILPRLIAEFGKRKDETDKWATSKLAVAFSHDRNVENILSVCLTPYNFCYANNCSACAWAAFSIPYKYVLYLTSERHLLRGIGVRIIYMDLDIY